MSRKKVKIAYSGEAGRIQNPFEALDALGNLPAGPEDAAPAIPVKTSRSGRKNANRGRVDIIRQTAHRGGKAVTVVKNFTGIGLPEIQELAKKMRKVCGVGGTVKEGCIEIQGDQRDEVRRILKEAGFNPVFAGG